MSIIYDALKKVQKSSAGDEKIQVPPKKPASVSMPVVILLYVLIACLGIFGGNAFFNLLSRSPAKTNPLLTSESQQPNKPEAVPVQKLAKESNAAAAAKITAPIVVSSPTQASPPAPEEVKSEPSVPLDLSGVFFSQNEWFALINNQIVKIGDVIGGATVKRIDLEGVELEIGTSKIKLTSKQK